MENIIFAVDIGGSKLVCGALTESGRILEEYRVDYKPGYTVDDLLGWIREGFEKLKKYAFSYCGAAIPGLYDFEKGVWLYSPFSGISDIPILELLSKITGLRTVADNDVNISAVAERYFGVCRDVEDFLWVTVSNGIGGGLYLGGKLYRGPHMTAGEIGHVIVEEEGGRLCGCGNRGCLEAMASGASIGAIYNERRGTSLSAKEIAELARSGDREAMRVWEEAGAYIGKAAAHTVNLLGIDTVVLGGGAADAFDLLAPAAEKAFSRYVFQKANPNARILHSQPGKHAALMGCAALVLDTLLK